MITPLHIIQNLITDKVSIFPPSAHLSYRFSSTFNQADPVMLKLYIQAALSELSLFTNLTFKEHDHSRHRSSNIFIDLQNLTLDIYGSHNYPVGSCSNITFNLRYINALNSGSERHLIYHLICGALGISYAFNPDCYIKPSDQLRVNQSLSYGVRSAFGYQLPEITLLRQMYGHRDLNLTAREYHYRRYLNSVIVNDDGYSTLNIEGLEASQIYSIKNQLLGGEHHLVIDNYNWISILNPDLIYTLKTDNGSIDLY